MKSLTKLFFVLIFLIPIINFHSQSFSGSFMVGIPQGEYSKYQKAGIGFNFQGTLWNPTRYLPYTVGFEFGFMGYQADYDYSYYYDEYYISRMNGVLDFHIVLKAMPFMDIVRPYVEGLFGGAYLFTADMYDNEYNLISMLFTPEHSDFTWNYGGSVGILIQLSDFGDDAGIFLDLKARYLFGTTAEFLKLEDIYYDYYNDELVYYITKSKTDLLIFSLGVTAGF
ncbi:MAG: hypothetical protein JW866_11125 [Ignavibacteriales bacterium]|nr:hypothetical protein [Ignavibacteriales bacterium]